MSRTCASWELFRKGVEIAGNGLTPDSWVAGVESLGPVDLPGQRGLTFEPGKRDGGNTAARYVFDSELR